MENCTDYILDSTIDIKESSWMFRQKEQFSALHTWQILGSSVLQSSATAPGYPGKFILQSPCSYEDILKVKSWLESGEKAEIT